MKKIKFYFLLVTNLFVVQTLQADDHHHGHHEKAEPAPVVAISEDSIYNLNSVLLDSNGRNVKLDSFKGKPVVISMAYTSCAYTCPLILTQMQQLETELVKKNIKNVHFILISFDPQKDTPQVLKDYHAKKKLSERWNLLTSKTDSAPREIANILGIKYKKVEGGDYDHSFVITVLDGQGVIKGQQNGANGDPKELAKFISQ